MGMLDGLLGQVTQNVDIQGLAAKLGLTPEQVEQGVQALGAAHPAPGDTAETAAADTGLPVDKLQEMIAHIGGEGALGRFSNLLQEGEGGGLLGKLGGMASGFLKGEDGGGCSIGHSFHSPTSEAPRSRRHP